MNRKKERRKSMKHTLTSVGSESPSAWRTSITLATDHVGLALTGATERLANRAQRTGRIAFAQHRSFGMIADAANKLGAIVGNRFSVNAYLSVLAAVGVEFVSQI